MSLSMMSVNEIFDQLQKTKVLETHGLYFLYLGADLVYVGQSVSIGCRVYNHLAEGIKTFNHYAIYDCAHLSQAEVNCLEALFILEYAPRFNGSVPQNDKYKSLSQIQNASAMSRWELRRFIRDRGIKQIGKYGEYYQASDFVEVTS